MPEPSVQLVVRDILVDLDGLNPGLVARVALKEVVRQIGMVKAKEHARRVAASYIDSLDLAIGERIARRLALPAVDRWVEDAIEELQR